MLTQKRAKESEKSEKKCARYMKKIGSTLETTVAAQIAWVLWLFLKPSKAWCRESSAASSICQPKTLNESVASR
jgi:hypothetical protein